ncbi:MAG: hypothetical protein KGR46_01430 [Verrucomicrobia bacterium]|nr:hypothetical protein [Verrucomicrobiota bacterium]
MPSDQASSWFLKKHGQNETFGPVNFGQIQSWANSAYIHPQDTVSPDGQTWNKAPMVVDLGMDWLVEVPDNPLYGPTTPGAVMEFLRMGEINTTTVIVNCCTGETMPLAQAPFFVAAAESEDAKAAREGLRKKVMELQSSLLQKQSELNLANQTIESLRAVVGRLEAKLQG